MAHDEMKAVREEGKAGAHRPFTQQTRLCPVCVGTCAWRGEGRRPLTKDLVSWRPAVPPVLDLTRLSCVSVDVHFVLSGPLGQSPAEAVPSRAHHPAPAAGGSHRGRGGGQQEPRRPLPPAVSTADARSGRLGDTWEAEGENSKAMQEKQHFQILILWLANSISNSPVICKTQ